MVTFSNILIVTLFHRICKKCVVARMLLDVKIQIRAIQISDYLVYIKVQRTSNLTDIMCPRAAY